MDYTQKEAQSKIALFNQVLTLATKTGMLRKLLTKYDPVELNNLELIGSIPFNVLGRQYQIKPVIKELDFTGLSGFVPRTINVTAPHSIQIGNVFESELKMSGIVSLKVIRQPEGIPFYIDMDISLGVLNPTFASKNLIEMLECAPGTTEENCKNLQDKDFTQVLEIAESYLAADNHLSINEMTLQNQFQQLFNRIFKRIQTVAVEEVELGFDAISSLDFNIHGTGDVVRSIFKALTRAPIEEINQKGEAYTKLVNFSRGIVKSLGNGVIKVFGFPFFGRACKE
jgi:hypothetical protein